MNVCRAYPRPVSCFATPDEVKRIDRMARRLREAESADDGNSALHRAQINADQVRTWRRRRLSA